MMHFLSKSASSLILNSVYWDKSFGQNSIKYCDIYGLSQYFSIYGNFLQLKKKPNNNRINDMEKSVKFCLSCYDIRQGQFLTITCFPPLLT